MHEMDLRAQAQYEALVAQRLEEYAEEASLRNDEVAFLRQKKMPPVTDAVLKQTRHAYSEPLPVLSSRRISELERRHGDACRSVECSAQGLLCAQKSDALQAKMESLKSKCWAEWDTSVQQDRGAREAYLHALRLQELKDIRSGRRAQ
jgi:hypothetical protein